MKCSQNVHKAFTKHSPDVHEAKLGILCGTLASALAGSLMLHLTLPKQLDKLQKCLGI